MVTPRQDLPSDDEDLSITRPPSNASTLPATPARYSSSAPVGSGSSVGGGGGVGVGGSVGGGAGVSVGSGSGVTVASGGTSTYICTVWESAHWPATPTARAPKRKILRSCSAASMGTAIDMAYSLVQLPCHWPVYQELRSRSTRTPPQARTPHALRRFARRRWPSPSQRIGMINTPSERVSE